MKIPELLKSKKAQAVLAGILTVLLGEGLGLDDDAVAQIVGLIMAYCVGQGIADINAKSTTTK